MKVLWVSNSPIGPMAEILGEEYKGTSGGWIKTEYEALDKSDIQMYYLCTLPNVKSGEYIEKTNENGTVYCISSPKIPYGVPPSQKTILFIQSIINRINPDIIQLWGTETYLSNAVSRCSKNIPKIVYIQGIIGVHKRYLGGYFLEKENAELYKGRSFFAKVKSAVQNIMFVRQADIEAQTVSNCKNIISDNILPLSYFESVTENVRLFNRPLLPNQKFFEYSWDLEKMRPHTIFTVFGGTAEKGLHQLLRAVSVVKKEYPDVKVYVPGNYPLDGNGRLLLNRKNAYMCALYNLIDKLELQENVEFLGRLDMDGMAQAICKANVFVNPSCMEVHALSLREAMAIGAPCVTSLCGSVLDYVKHRESGLIYRYEEYEVLAHHIKTIFSDSSFSEQLSNNARNAHIGLGIGQTLSLNEIYSECIKG